MPNVTYSTQLSVFVIFDKKAGVIRIADSAVSEVEFPVDHAEMGLNFRETLSSSNSSRRSRHSDTHGHTRQPWILPKHIELPALQTTGQATLPRTVYLLTRGKTTHVLPSPLPASIANTTPLLTLSWPTQPSDVSPRACFPPEGGGPPFLQLVALGPDGIEVQEVSLSFLDNKKGKGRMEEPIRVSTDIGDAGYLCLGGHWHRPGLAQRLTRTQSVASDYSATSFDSMDTDEIAAKLEREQGLYGWCRRGVQDWRIFWVGGTGEDTGEDEEE